MIVHFWIIWSALNKDRAVLDVFNNFLNGWLITQQPHVLETVQERFALYNEAFSKDVELHAQGLMTLKFTSAALQCLLNNGKPLEKDLGFLLSVEVDTRLSSTFPAVRKFREEFTIRTN